MITCRYEHDGSVLYDEHYALECEFLAGYAFCKTNPHVCVFTSSFNTDILNFKKNFVTNSTFQAQKHQNKIV
jgi:hypothetical protein